MTELLLVNYCSISQLSSTLYFIIVMGKPPFCRHNNTNSTYGCNNGVLPVRPLMDSSPLNLRREGLQHINVIFKKENAFRVVWRNDSPISRYFSTTTSV